jgi:DNA modification methylase
MSLKINEIYQGSAPDLLKKISNNSIALSVWSPPYFVGKEYEKHLSYNGWVSLLQQTIKSHFAVLKPGGFLVINIADILCFPDERIPKFQSMNIGKHKSSITKEDVIRAKTKHPNYNRNQLAALLGCSEQTVDRRLNGNNIRGGKYGTQTRVHLVGDILEKAAYDAGMPLYDRRIWKKDAAWQNSKWHNSSYRSVDEFEYLYFFWKPGVTIVNREKLTSNEWKEWGSKAVWEFPSVRANNDHEAKFPIELPRRVIKLLTEKGDTVLDCFMGSGTTAIAAIREERNYIGIDLMQQYVDLSKSKIQNEIKTTTLLNRQLKITDAA